MIYGVDMIVLSLFDGISCGRVALERAGIPINKYYASEIDRYAIKISEKNHPDIIQLGDINEWANWGIEFPDLVIGGSPCQGFSFAGKQLAFDDPRSALFWKYIEILNYYKPKYFLLENVKMKQEYLQVITDALGVEPICINSALVSAQNRVRYYWTNIPNVTQPEDKGIVLKDIIEHGVCDRDKSFCVDANYWKGGDLKQYFEKHRRQLIFQPIHTSERGRRLNPEGTARDDKNGSIVRGYEVRPDGKTCALTTVLKDNYVTEDYIIRKLTPVECERLQTLPDNYTELLENRVMYLYDKNIVDNLIKGEKWIKNVSIQNAQEIHKPTDSVICALDVTKECFDTGSILKNLGKLKNVNFVIERQLPGAGATDIIRIGAGGETRDILIRLGKILDREDIRKELMVETSTGLLWKITWEESWGDMKKFTILTWIKLIIELRICTYVKTRASIHLSIDNLRTLPDSSLEVEISGFKMESTLSKISNTQRYKMLGNGWTVDVLAHIFKNIKIGDNNDKINYSE